MRPRPVRIRGGGRGNAARRLGRRGCPTTASAGTVRGSRPQPAPFPFRAGSDRPAAARTRCTSTTVCNAYVQPQVVIDQRLHVRVAHGGTGALKLADLRTDFAADGHAEIRE